MKKKTTPTAVIKAEIATLQKAEAKLQSDLLKSAAATDKKLAAIHAASRQMQTVCRAYNAGLRATAKQSDAIERRLSILTARLGNA